MSSAMELKVRGSFDNITKFLRRVRFNEQYKNIERLAQRGVDALASATPKDTGNTASSWTYKILFKDRGEVSIEFLNYNKTESGIPIVILLEYGHTTGTGGYVKGLRYIQPTIQPLMDEIAEEVWKEICKK